MSIDHNSTSQAPFIMYLFYLLSLPILYFIDADHIIIQLFSLLLLGYFNFYLIGKFVIDYLVKINFLNNEVNILNELTAVVTSITLSLIISQILNSISIVFASTYLIIQLSIIILILFYLIYNNQYSFSSFKLIIFNYQNFNIQKTIITSLSIMIILLILFSNLSINNEISTSIQFETANTNATYNYPVKNISFQINSENNVSYGYNLTMNNPNMDSIILIIAVNGSLIREISFNSSQIIIYYEEIINLSKILSSYEISNFMSLNFKFSMLHSGEPLILTHSLSLEIMG